MTILCAKETGTLSRVLRRPHTLNAGLCFIFSLSLVGLSAQGPSPSQIALVPSIEKALPVPLTLHYEDPITFPVGTTQSIVFGDFKCDRDNTVYVPISDPISAPATQMLPTQSVIPSMTVIALKTSGEILRFAPRPVDGYRNVTSLLRYYVSTTNFYLLALGDKVDPTNSDRSTERSHFIQVFDLNGQFVRTLTLDPDIEPANIAAFTSGEILVFQTDKLNHSTRLVLLDPSGRVAAQSGLFEHDFAKRIESMRQNHSASSSGSDQGARLNMLLSNANLVTRGEDLLLTASQANLPTIELNQHGTVVRAVTLATPADMVISAMLPSNGSTLQAVVGNLRTLSPPGTATTTEEPRVFFPKEIDEFEPLDGALLRRIALEQGAVPVCANSDNYTFLSPRGTDGKLQIIHATPVVK